MDPTQNPLRHRRERLLEVGHTLFQALEKIAWNPAGMVIGMAAAENPSLRFKVAVEWAKSALKGIAIPDYRLRKLHPMRDIQPLVNIYNTLMQSRALLVLKEESIKELNAFKTKLEDLQNDIPDHVGSIVADIHDFIVFATFANKVHPGHVLTTESVSSAGKLASKSRSPQIKRAFFALRQAYGIQSGRKAGIRLTKKVVLSYVTMRVIENWYEGYKGHHAEPGKERFETLIPFKELVKWFVDCRRKMVNDSQTVVRSSIKAVVGQSFVSTRIAMGGYDGELEDRAARSASAELANSITKLWSQFPLPMFGNSGICQGKGLPLYTKFSTNPENNEVTQKLQKLMTEVYAVFSRSSRSTLEILNATYFSTPGDFRKTMAEDTAKSFASHLRAIDVFFHRLRTTNAVVYRPAGVASSTSKGEIPLLNAVFKVSMNPTIAEEELLSEVTGLTLPQVGTWFLIERT